MSESEKEKLEQLFINKEGCGLFGVKIDDGLVTIIGMGMISHSEKAFIIFSLKSLVKRLENELELQSQGK